MAVNRALLDMDGVLCNFVDAISHAQHRPSPYLDPSNWGVWDMEKIWGMSVPDFYRPTESLTFWSEMKKMPGADQLVAELTDQYGEANIAILSAPTQSQFCIPGKKQWMRRHYPQFANRMFFGRQKEFFSVPGMNLYDDRDTNIDAFNRGNGKGILIPQLWNSGWRSLTLMEENAIRTV